MTKLAFRPLLIAGYLQWQPDVQVLSEDARLANDGLPDTQCVLHTESFPGGSVDV